MYDSCCPRKQLSNKTNQKNPNNPNLPEHPTVSQRADWVSILSAKHSYLVHVKCPAVSSMASQTPLRDGAAPLMASLPATYTMPCITPGTLKAWSKAHWIHPDAPDQGRNEHIHTFLLCFILYFMCALPSSQPRNYRLLPVRLKFWPQNECDPSSLSPQKKFWYFHFFSEQHIISVCKQSDFMVFLFVDRMIGIKLHSVDKKCDEMSFVNIIN